MTNDESVMAGLDPAISFHLSALFTSFVIPAKVGVRLCGFKFMSKIPFIHNRTFI